METKINITTILKDKPKGTKLYSTVHGECTFETITDEIFKIHFCTSKFGLTQTGECVLIKFGNMFDGGECVVFPSKEMRDWSKFAWKKGDVLISMEGSKILFDKWVNEDYTKFLGKIKVLGNSHCYDTAFYNLVSEEEAQEFIKSIEKTYGGKLNLETLEIEKTQPEFKDGDILCVIDSSDDYHYILIYKGQDDKYIYHYVTMFENNSLYIRKDAHLTKPKDYSMRYATEEEKKQLFSALEKEGKRWDSGKKEVVDLKPKVELKPFDRVLVRNDKEDQWSANIFSYQVRDNMYYCLGENYWRYCIPYIGNESLLGTTKDMEG